MKITDILHTPNIQIGDEVLVGKFKNRKAVVTGFATDENNQPVLKTTKGDQKLFKPRIVKLVDKDEQLIENLIGTALKFIAKQGYKVTKSMIQGWLKNAPPGVSPTHAADIITKGIATAGSGAAVKKHTSKNEAVNEGYKLQLERDADMMVLNITDTKSGKRTEVRGKAGYETNGYDKNDKLHQLLDKISKTANISELMNGEPVGINPKHPDGASAKTATTQAFNESLDNPYSYYWDETYNGDESFLAKAEMDIGELMVMFSVGAPGVSWTIDFAVDGSMDKTGAGDQFRIFATVVAVIKDWAANKVDLSKVTQIYFSSDKGEGDS